MALKHNVNIVGKIDAKTGKLLWEFPTNSGIIGQPSTFSVDDVQYVAVQSGWGVDAQRMQARLDTFRGTKTDVPQGGVFKFPFKFDSGSMRPRFNPIVLSRAMNSMTTSAEARSAPSTTRSPYAPRCSPGPRSSS